MKYIDNRINANIVKLEDENNNYMSEDVEGALEEIDSKIKTIEANGYDDTQVRQHINNIKTEIGTEELTTNSKNIKGSVNELNSQIKDIANKFHIYPEDFGAKGDGLTDDTQAIKSALNYCRSNKKILSLLEEKTYKVTDQLDFSKISIIGNNSTISFNIDNNTTNCVIVNNTYEIPGTENIYRIENIKFNFNNTGQDGFVIKCNKRLYIDNIYFINSYRDSFVVDVRNDNGFSENLIINNIYVYKAGRNMASFYIGSVRNGFINSLIMNNFEGRGLSVNFDNGHGMYFHSCSTNPGDAKLGGCRFTNVMLDALCANTGRNCSPHPIYFDIDDNSDHYFNIESLVFNGVYPEDTLGDYSETANVIGNAFYFKKHPRMIIANIKLDNIDCSNWGRGTNTTNYIGKINRSYYNIPMLENINTKNTIKTKSGGKYTRDNLQFPTFQDFTVRVNMTGKTSAIIEIPYDDTKLADHLGSVTFMEMKFFATYYGNDTNKFYEKWDCVMYGRNGRNNNLIVPLILEKTLDKDPNNIFNVESIGYDSINKLFSINISTTVNYGDMGSDEFILGQIRVSTNTYNPILKF